MNIDIRTMIIVIGITNLIQVIALYFQFRINKSYRGVGWWLLAFLCLAVGFIFTLLREVMSFDLLTIITASALTFSGPVLVYIGVMRFLGKKEQRGMVIGLYAAFILSYFYFTYGNNDINARSVISAVLIAFYSFLTARELFVYKPQSINASATILSTAWFIQGIFFIIRTVELLTASPINSYFTPTLIQAVTFLFTLIISLLVTFGLIIMINQRMNVEMREAKEQAERIFNTSPDGAVITRLDDGLVLDINDGFTALTGYTRSETVGKSSLEIPLWKNPADRQKVTDELRKNGFCENMEADFLRKDGSPLTGSMSAKIIPLQGAAHIISVTHDISNRVRADKEIRQLNAELEQRVAQRTAHLDAANKEMATFTYSISHDLRTPLRAIGGFSEIIARRHRSDLNEEGRHYFDNIVEASRHMEALVEALLQYSQLGRNGVRRELVELESIFKKLAADLEERLAREHALLSIAGELPTLMSDRSLLTRIFSILLDNALVYHPQDLPAQVSVTWETDDNGYIFKVSDNGIGIPAEYHEKIFNVFQRLHNQEEYPGAGIGLAMVSKSVQLLGGKVHVESQPGKGSTFSVYLPKE